MTVKNLLFRLEKEYNDILKESYDYNDEYIKGFEHAVALCHRTVKILKNYDISYEN